MGKRILFAAGLIGALAVVLGAFGAHALEKWALTLADGAKRLEWWATASRYHFWHALLLLGIGVLAQRRPAPLLQSAAISCVAGIVLFSGSLYVMTGTGIKALGMVTPIGGVLLIASWVMLAVAVRNDS